MSDMNHLPLPAKPQSISVKEAVDDFLERDLSANTWRNFHSDLRRFCRDFGTLRVDAVTTADIRKHLGSLRGRGRKAASVETYNRHRATLHALYGWLIREDEVALNPVSRVERKKVGSRLPRPLTRRHVEVLFDHLRNLRERALFSLLYFSGLRVDEALSLNIEDVDFRSGTFRIVGKGDAERVGYLSEQTRPLLRRYLRERGKPGEGPLFTSRQGRLSYAMARILFRDSTAGLKNADGSPVTIHQIRHAFGSERAGKMDALVLRDLMGHRSIRTTLRYAEVNPARTREAFRKFDRELR